MAEWRNAGGTEVFAIHGRVTDFRCVNCRQWVDVRVMWDGKPCPVCGTPISTDLTTYVHQHNEREDRRQFEEWKRQREG